MVRHTDLQEALLDPSTDEGQAAGMSRLSRPFGHIIVDEAQELSDTEWRIILLRCPSNNSTIVGDPA